MTAQEIVAPHSALINKIIHNIRRSNSMIDYLKIQVSFQTPLEKIQEAKSRLQGWVRENPDRFTKNFDIYIESVCLI